VRIFWSIVALIVIGAVVALWHSQRSAPPRGTTAPSIASPQPQRTDTTHPADALAIERDESRAGFDARGPGRDPIAGVDPAPNEREALVAELLASASERRERRAAGDGHGFDEEDDDDAELLDLGMDAQLEGATIRRGRIVRLEDGTIRADRRFTIRGSGAARDPYRVTWELIMSASETFQPRLGEFEIPQRVAMLHGKHVRIEGFAAFPSASFDPREMLMMLNQWDGCCIGVPPTPFDAIEVQLKAAPAQRRPAVSYYGTVTGLFSVEPFLIDSWLVGMYLMDEASVNLGL